MLPPPQKRGLARQDHEPRRLDKIKVEIGQAEDTVGGFGRRGPEHGGASEDSHKRQKPKPLVRAQPAGFKGFSFFHFFFAVLEDSRMTVAVASLLLWAMVK